MRKSFYPKPQGEAHCLCLQRTFRTCADDPTRLLLNSLRRFSLSPSVTRPQKGGRGHSRPQLPFSCPPFSRLPVTGPPFSSSRSHSRLLRFGRNWLQPRPHGSGVATCVTPQNLWPQLSMRRWARGPVRIRSRISAQTIRMEAISSTRLRAGEAKVWPGWWLSCHPGAHREETEINRLSPKDISEPTV